MARQVGIFYWRTYFDVGMNDTYTNVNSLLRNNSIGAKNILKMGILNSRLKEHATFISLQS